MSFIKKAMANVFGVGGTKVDTVLTNSTVSPGGKVEGFINIYGGEVSQDIQNVYIDVKTTYEKEGKDSTLTINDTLQKYSVSINKTINPNENLNIPFEFTLDLNCPITKGKSKVWLSTRLDIENAVDHIDGDGLNVVPTKYMENILKSITNLGFRTKSTKNIYDKYRMSKHSFVQEFEYYPTGEFRGRLDEIEVVLVSSSNGIRVILEVDRKVKGLASFISEQLDMDESLVYIDFGYNELTDYEYISEQIKGIIRRYS